jgi:hypothetical protein
MQVRIQLVAIVLAGLLLVVILEMVRRRRLQERYALLWLGSAVTLLGLAIWRGALGKLSEWMGISYPPNALFFVAFAFILLLLLHFSAAVSRLADQSKILAQRLALLEQRVGEDEERLRKPGDAERGDDEWREVAGAIVEPQAPAESGLRR